MKICLINNLYEPYSRGGAERVVEMMAGGFADGGHKVTVITSRPSMGENIDESDYLKGIKIVRFYPFNFFWIGDIANYRARTRLIWHFFDMFNIASFFELRKILKKENPDLVITNNLKGLGYLIPFAIKNLRIKYFHIIHDVQLAIPSGLIIKGKEDSWEHRIFLTKIYEKINKFLFSFPEAVISPSKWLMDFYSAKGFFKNSKKIILPNPAPKIKTNGIGDESRGEFQFIYVGQIEDYKGILFLIEAFKKLERDDYKLVIVGDGSSLEKAKKIAGNKSNVEFTGRQKYAEILNFYANSDITLVPSLCYENSPTVIYESLSVGTPVIASQIGGVSELVKDGINGYEFKAGDAEDLFKKINYCLDNKNKIKEMRAGALESVSDFSLKNYIEKIINLI